MQNTVYLTIRNTLIILALLFTLALIIPFADAVDFGISTNTTENSIIWYFDEGTYYLIADGIPVGYPSGSETYTGSYYLMSNLEPNSPHFITLVLGEESITIWKITKQNFYNSPYIIGLIVMLIFMFGSFIVSFLGFFNVILIIYVLLEWMKNYSDNNILFIIPVCIFFMSLIHLWSDY